MLPPWHPPFALRSQGIDNQGTGRSGGLFGYVEDFRHFVDDLLQLCKTLQASGAPQGFGPGLPLFGLGASLGGCIALQASMRQVRRGGAKEGGEGADGRRAVSKGA